VFIVIELTIIN